MANQQKRQPSRRETVYDFLIEKEIAVLGAIAVIVVLTLLVPPLFRAVAGDDIGQGWEVIGLLFALIFVWYLVFTLVINPERLAGILKRTSRRLGQIGDGLADYVQDYAAFAAGDPLEQDTKEEADA